MIRAVDNEAATKWTQIIGDENLNVKNSAYSVGFSIIQVIFVTFDAELIE